MFNPQRFKKTWNRVQQERTERDASGRNARFSSDDAREHRKRRAVRELKLLGLKLVVGVAFALFLYFYVTQHVAEQLKPHAPNTSASPLGVTP